jgi:hypothetical protein
MFFIGDCLEGSIVKFINFFSKGVLKHWTAETQVMRSHLVVWPWERYRASLEIGKVKKDVMIIRLK